MLNHFIKVFTLSFLTIFCVDEINNLQALRLCFCKVTVVDFTKYLHEQGMSWAGRMLNKIN